MRTAAEIKAELDRIEALKAELVAAEKAEQEARVAREAALLEAANTALSSFDPAFLDSLMILDGKLIKRPAMPAPQPAPLHRTKGAAKDYGSGPWTGKGRATGCTCVKQGPDFLVTYNGRSVGSATSLSGAGRMAVEACWSTSGYKQRFDANGGLVGWTAPNGDELIRPSVSPEQVWIVG